MGSLIYLTSTGLDHCFVVSCLPNFSSKMSVVTFKDTLDFGVLNLLIICHRFGVLFCWNLVFCDYQALPLGLRSGNSHLFNLCPRKQHFFWTTMKNRTTLQYLDPNPIFKCQCIFRALTHF